jgi:hypothetical protein
MLMLPLRSPASDQFGDIPVVKREKHYFGHLVSLVISQIPFSGQKPPSRIPQEAFFCCGHTSLYQRKKKFL